MEIQIDTSQLSASKNSAALQTKIEENVSKEIESFAAFNKKILNTLTNKYDDISTMTINESYVISIIILFIENSEERNIVVFGRIENNNQTFYEFNTGAYVYVYIKNPLVCNKIISEFGKFMDRHFKNKNENLDYDIDFQMQFDINDHIFIPSYTGNKSIICTQILYIPTMFKIYFSLIAKYKFDKWESILFNTSHFEEAYLSTKIFQAIGYKVTYNTENFKGDELYDTWDSGEFKIPLVNLSEMSGFNSDGGNQINKMISYSFNHICDTTSNMLSLKNKISTYTLLKNGGVFHLIDVPPEESTQFFPGDLEYCYNRNLTITFTNLEQCLRYSRTAGREMNYISEVIDKLINEQCLHNHLKEILKKLQCKVVDMTEVGQKKDTRLSISALTDRKDYLNLIIIR